MKKYHRHVTGFVPTTLAILEQPIKNKIPVRLFPLQAIGARLEEIERQEARDLTVVIGKVKDESVRKRLREQDDQEDFLDEGRNLKEIFK